MERDETIRYSTDQRPFIMVYKDFLESDLLKADEKILFIILKSFSNEQGQSFPSVQKLVEKTGYSKRKIQDLLKSLERKKVLVKECRKRSDGGQSSNLYTLYDYSKLWNTGSKGKDVKTISEARMIEELKARGYTITKEKGLVSEPTKEQKQDTKKQKIKLPTNNDITPSEAECQENYTFTTLKEIFCYETMLFDRPERKADIDSAMSILYDAVNTTKRTVRIQGENKSAKAVATKLLKLSHADILYTIDRFNEQTERIKNPKSYMLTLLYNAKEQYNLDVANQVQHDFSSSGNKEPEKETARPRDEIAEALDSLWQEEECPFEN